MNIERFGELNSEKIANDNSICRMIVKEITDFGINQNQLMMILYLLSLQIENHEHMSTLASTIKEIGSETFLENQNGDSNG